MCMDFNYMKDFPDLCHPTLGEAHYMDEKSSFYSSKWDLLLLSYGYLERCCLLPSTGRDLSLKLCILDRIFCQLTVCFNIFFNMFSNFNGMLMVFVTRKKSNG